MFGFRICAVKKPINWPPRDELLNETLFVSPHARLALATWKLDYNTVRPHGAIGNVPPAIYAKLGDPAMQTGRVAALDWGLRAPPRCTTEPGRLK